MIGWAPRVWSPDWEVGNTGPVYNDNCCYGPECRHNEGANFLFMDGHVKWMRKGAGWSRSNELWDLN